MGADSYGFRSGIRILIHSYYRSNGNRRGRRAQADDVISEWTTHCRIIRNCKRRTIRIQYPGAQIQIAIMHRLQLRVLDGPAHKALIRKPVGIGAEADKYDTQGKAKGKDKRDNKNHLVTVVYQKRMPCFFSIRFSGTPFISLAVAVIAAVI